MHLMLMSEPITDHRNGVTVTGLVMSTDQEAFPEPHQDSPFGRWREGSDNEPPMN